MDTNRKAARWRQRRIIYNNDGDDMKEMHNHHHVHWQFLKRSGAELQFRLYVWEYSDSDELAVTLNGESMRKLQPAGAPEHMVSCWEWDYCSFHSPDWWKAHWMKSGKVDVGMQI